MKAGELLTKHRNLFLVLLLAATLAISGAANQERLQANAPTVEIPVMAVSTPPLSPLEAYRHQRDTDTASDIAALEKLIAQSMLDKQTRDAAADQLQRIIDIRQAQSAMEGALLNSSLAPCVVVLAGDAMTLVTAKSTITDKDAAQVLTLASAHAGIRPENVRIITAE